MRLPDNYFQVASAGSRHAEYALIPQSKWRRELGLPRLLRGLDKEYATAFAASIDNPNVQYVLNRIRFAALETFRRRAVAEHLREGVNAAAARSVELGRDLG